MTIPAAYDIDADVFRSDLQQRARDRMLIQFHRSPVLLRVLSALVAEVQVLHDAIVDVIKYRMLYHAEGASIDSIGRIVGQPRLGWNEAPFSMAMEDVGQTLIVEEDNATEILVNVPSFATDIPDDDYKQLILLRIAKNTTKYCSVPELAAAIKQATGITAQIRLTGPMQVDVIVPTGTDPQLVHYITQSVKNQRADDEFLFPWPATLEAQLVYNDSIMTEDGFDILLEDEESPMITENIPL